MLSTLASVPKAGGETGSSMRCITSSSSARTMPASRSASPLTACLRHQPSSALSAGRAGSAPRGQGWTSRDPAQKPVACLGWGLTGHETRHCYSHRPHPLNAAGTGTAQRAWPPGWGWDPLTARLGHLDGVMNVAVSACSRKEQGTCEGAVGHPRGMQPAGSRAPARHSRCWKVLKMLMRVKWSPSGWSRARRCMVTASSRCAEGGTKQGEAGDGAEGGSPRAPQHHPRQRWLSRGCAVPAAEWAPSPPAWYL